ncbi:MAG: WecB/TagA/CpsF family glycosyltransferase [Phyllobacteriaceae bacterium]|jgi:exopolysaccharide biosynthesis WecB/TagA/CpsF family protein|nr:WecB/TagA/CpsF family glycosyltransferase [Phyllobacteriaceae bacterium]
MTDIVATHFDEPAGQRDILGVAVADFSEEEALDMVHAAIDHKTYRPIAFLNANNANIGVEDAAFRTALARFTVLSDGVGVDVAAKMLHGAAFRANLNGTDFVPALFRSAKRPLKVGLFGARPGVAELAAGHFGTVDPRHDYRALADGFIDADGEAALLDTLTQWRPDILLVALGVPRQEKWIVERLTPDHCTVPIAVGALFDLSTGEVPRAPMWLRRLRSEWIYRLWQEPRRLWRRYIVGNPVFLARVLRQRLTGNG